MTGRKFPLSLRVALLALAWVVVSAAPAVADLRAAGKLDPLLRARAAQLTGRSRVIVEFAGEPDVRVFGRGAVGRRVGARAQVGEVDNRVLAALAADARVARVVVDRLVFPTLERTGAATGATAARADLGVTGRGVGIAVVDSGITSWHEDLYRTADRRQLARRVVHFKDFTRRSSPSIWLSELPVDHFGHGTHVAGILAGSGALSRGARAGLAPGAHLIGLKVLDARGFGHMSDVIAAIDYAIASRDAYNIRVINLSVAAAVIESYRSDPLALAARRAVDAGIVVVAAAGNLGRAADGTPQAGAITSPGNAPWVLTVGAASHNGTVQRGDDAIARFSSRGPTALDFLAKPDLVAPGVGLESLSDPHSTLYTTQAAYLLEGSEPTWYKPYLSMSGTSMAAPVVSAAVALMLEANPALTPNAVKALLQYSAEARAGADALSAGAGLLNARGAVRLARFFAAPNAGPGLPADVIAGEVVLWSQQIVWGNYRVSGGVPLPGGTAWQPGVAWGDLVTAAGEPVVWGAGALDTIVWSTAVDDGIIWSTAALADGIIWSTAGTDTIIWSTGTAENVVWGSDCGGRDCRGVVWGAPRGDGTTWGTAAADDTIIWSTRSADGIIWSTAGIDTIIWSTTSADQVVWPATQR